MAQSGSIWRKGDTWFLRYRDNFNVDGKIIRKQKCVKLPNIPTATAVKVTSMIW